MASLEVCFTEEEKRKIYEALNLAAPLDPSYFSTFKFKWSGVEISLKASSQKEAATKFWHCLFSVNQTATSTIIYTKENPLTFQCENLESGERVEYRGYVSVSGSERKPLIVTSRILKRFTSNLTSRTDEAAKSGMKYASQKANFHTLEREDDDGIHGGIGTTVDEIIEGTLHRYFCYQNFKPLQRDIIKATLSGKNVLGILGTGSGKSLTFLLPAVLSSAPTFVVVPTTALIDDMLVRCQDLNIASCKFTGSTTKEHQKSQLENFGSYKVIFASPEMVEGDLMDKIKSSKVERIVFDEAHIITTWGNTFRPVYKAICEQLSKLRIPKLLLSATVPANCQEELSNIFGTFMVIRNTVFRDNLVLEVQDRPSGPKFYDRLALFIKEHKGCGIVYCVFTSDVTKIHAEMIKRDINCAMYHGQLSDDVKLANFNKWNSGESNAMIANAAFGLGIDKSNVRYVVHAKVPPTIEDYYQQCGRAGRDGQESICCMFYSPTDKTALLRMFHQQNLIEKQTKHLNDLIILLEDPVQCRHKNIMTYYGEERDGFMCGRSCDNCRNRGHFVVTDGSPDALKVVQAVMELTGKEITFNNLKLFLAGSNQKSIKEKNLDTLSTFGSLKKQFIPVMLLQKFLSLLIYHNVLNETVTFKRNSISVAVTLGQNAHKVIDHKLYIPKFVKL